MRIIIALIACGVLLIPMSEAMSSAPLDSRIDPTYAPGLPMRPTLPSPLPTPRVAYQWIAPHEQPPALEMIAAPDMGAVSVTAKPVVRIKPLAIHRVLRSVRCAAIPF